MIKETAKGGKPQTCATIYGERVAWPWWLRVGGTEGGC